MNGIPIELDLDNSREQILLSTRRSGELGMKVAELKRKFRNTKLAVAGKLQRVTALAKQAEAATADSELSTILDRQETLIGELAAMNDEMQAAAETIVRLALEDNYPPDVAERYMDAMTDAQVLLAVSIIETGDVPADFFPRRATQPSGSITSPSGAMPLPGSSQPGSDGGISKPATS